MQINKIKENYPELNISEHGQIIAIEMFDIDYADFLKIQKQLTEDVRNNPEQKYYLFASHPLTLTMGRGDRQNKELANESQAPTGIPLFHIKRGGGLTFHTPHQWIFYPILKLNNSNHTLTKHIEWLMNIVIETSKEFYNIDLKSQRNPLGVWYGLNKVASVGVGIERFITNHGLAFNVDRIEMTSSQFAMLNPCGLSSQTYKSLSELIDQKVKVKDFHQRCLETLKLTN